MKKRKQLKNYGDFILISLSFGKRFHLNLFEFQLLISLENGRSKFWFGNYWHSSLFHQYTRWRETNKQKKCGRLEMYNLVKESVEFKISSEIFTETLNSLIENKSVIVNTFKNCECISLPKRKFSGNWNWKWTYHGIISSI